MRTRTIPLTLIALAALSPLSVHAAGASSPGAARTVDASSMKGDQIRGLMKTESDGTRVKLGNSTFTVGQMKAFETKLRSHHAASKGFAPTRVRIKHPALQGKNQKVLAHVSQLAANPAVEHQAKLRDEAWDLNQKLKTASGGEKTQIHQRLAVIGSQMTR